MRQELFIYAMLLACVWWEFLKNIRQVCCFAYSIMGTVCLWSSMRVILVFLSSSPPHYYPCLSLIGAISFCHSFYSLNFSEVKMCFLFAEFLSDKGSPVMWQSLGLNISPDAFSNWVLNYLTHFRYHETHAVTCLTRMKLIYVQSDSGPIDFKAGSF